jgi:hypothetical protein
MRKLFGLAGIGLVAAVVMLAAPARSDAQVVVTPPPVVAGPPVVTYPYYPYYGRVVPHHRVWVRPHYRYYHARRWHR